MFRCAVRSVALVASAAKARRQKTRKSAFGRFFFVYAPALRRGSTPETLRLPGNCLFAAWKIRAARDARQTGR
jgi:hypothetical protein